jgi:hypothetical protein
MAEDPSEEAIKREVAAAARILREDGHAVRLAAIEARLDKAFPEQDPPNPLTPPRNPPKPSGGKRKSLWWGEIEE